MKEENLSDLSVDQLLQRFENVCIKQFETYDDLDTKKYNKYYDVMVTFVNELKSRGTEARLSLLRLFEHPNPQVRLQAASFAYRVAPEASRKCLEALEAAKLFDISLAAGMTLALIDNGTSALLKDD